MRFRVAQWSTGNVGRFALRGILTHPDLELVGLVVHSPDKAGTDAGGLCGLPTTGVAATTDVDEVIGLAPDAVCYTATADLRPNEAVEDMARLLRAGINVVSSSVVPLVEPAGAPDDLTRPLREAAEAGGASFYTNGIDPGLANDLVPIALMSACERVDRVRVLEILNYDTYDQPTVLFDTMGFGQPPDAEPLLLLPGVLSFAWGGVVRVLAAALGVELEDVREVHERLTTDEAFDVPSGTIPAGTASALRFEVQGIVDGEPAVVVEHVTRLRDDLAPHWPQPAGTGSYRIRIEGEPAITCDVQLIGSDGDHNTGGLIATAMRLVNAIPAVCAAAPGLLSTLDLPLFAGPHSSRLNPPSRINPASPPA